MTDTPLTLTMLSPLPVYLDETTGSMALRIKARGALDRLTRENVDALLSITADPVRLVRVKAAEALAPIPPSRVAEKARENLIAAQVELLSALNVRPDIWSSHYNLGNFYASGNQVGKAIASYETALRLEPRAILARTNISIIYSQTGQYDKAETSLRKALEIDPKSAPCSIQPRLSHDRKGECRGG